MVDRVTTSDELGPSGNLKPGESMPHSKKTMSVGICLGASTISVAWIKRHIAHPDIENRITIVRHAIYPHDGDPRQALLSSLSDFSLPRDHRLAVTGRRYRKHVNLPSISEPEAVGYAYRLLKPAGIQCPAIVSAGGETFMAYILDSAGNITNVAAGNKCASGTGEFFVQQLRRMNIPLDQVSRWSPTQTPYHVSGRCSVFCKSDCTHAMNTGVSRSRVAAGLCRMMADKIMDLIGSVPKKNIMFIGGTTRNQMMMSYLQDHIDNLIVPAQATCFEALGAALWALDHPAKAVLNKTDLFRTSVSRFDRLAPLDQYKDMVHFESMARDKVSDGDICLLGLDVGSTTTKAVLLRQADNALLASVYLRTNGDPVLASRQCYGALLEEIRQSANPDTITISGLGICGSGRQIAGLHAGTAGVINEIIAHSAAAVHFDPDVDTLFEIGGQDAKYTHITAGVASDYSMNEACSAGTGSFLEESALETLGVDVEDIAEMALRGNHPPNFNDQCAAFIASDIKTAIHDGLVREDIIAGLVYSVCMNYSNRVKGNRPVGRRIFMQGGVCYNRSVPMAMAALVGKPIIVPPEPGLMGAFGVALELKKRLDTGMIEPAHFDLEILKLRRVTYGRSFTCHAAQNRCDRRCSIAMVCIDGKRIPFGGACNRYTNMQKRTKVGADALDLVRRRQDIFLNSIRSPASKSPLLPGRNGSARASIGINRSFLFHSLYPLLATFFRCLDFEVRVPDRISRQGIAARGAAFCYPAELSHGYFHRLICGTPPPDYLFMPHFKSLPGVQKNTNAMLCPFVQGEPYFLRTTFRKQLQRAGMGPDRMLSPVLDMKTGLAALQRPLTTMAKKMGIPSRRSIAAAKHAIAVQNRCHDQLLLAGRQALDDLARDSQRIAAVVFGRPYNAFASEANMGIPRKMASRGVLVLPMDCLPVDDWPAKDHMYWAMGQRILQAARMVANHPQLFGVYITNFSCGPDSFLIGCFRDIMGPKPSLTLELDSHTADAGLETRIEAFVDVVNAWRHVSVDRPHQPLKRSFIPARIEYRCHKPGVVTSSNRWRPFTDPKVKLVFPSMGKLSSEALAAVFAGEGIRSTAAPPSDKRILKKGRANTTCKECLPLILTTGTLLETLSELPPDEVLVYFMATGNGPCRFGQYKVFMEDLIRKRCIENVALFSLSSDDGYDGLGRRIHASAWQSVVVADAMEDMRAMLLAAAADPKRAQHVFQNTWELMIDAIRSGEAAVFDRRLDRVSEMLGKIDLKQPVETIPVVSLIGEIFVRRDGISRQYITERLARSGFACTCAPVAEWIYYTDWLVASGIGNNDSRPWRRIIGSAVKTRFMQKTESRIKKKFARSGLIHNHPIRISEIVGHARPYIAPELQGEAILTVGNALGEIASRACGVIAIGPFGCMPNRVAESILNETMTVADKLHTRPTQPGLQHILRGMDRLPFLAVESDGSPFPQLIEAKLEAFCIQARRLHERMRSLPKERS
jgi:predicted CoA-substrate-specific enzyme activase